MGSSALAPQAEVSCSLLEEEKMFVVVLVHSMVGRQNLPEERLELCQELGREATPVLSRRLVVPRPACWSTPHPP